MFGSTKELVIVVAIVVIAGLVVGFGTLLAGASYIQQRRDTSSVNQLFVGRR